MANNVIVIDGQQVVVPAAMLAKRAAGQSINKRFVEGIPVSFPVVSIKGKLFTLRHNSRESSFEREGIALPIDVVLVDSNNRTQKAFYEKTYVEGEIKAPDCWSLDGVTPDAGLIAQGLAKNPTCGGCPLNEFNSATRNPGSTGKMTGKACKDVRRLALLFTEDLSGERLGPCAMRVPATSHKHLVNYYDELENLGLELNAVVTRLSFVQDKSIAYPILKFTRQRILTDEEFEIAQRYDREKDERTARILASPPEGDDLSGTSQAAQARAQASASPQFAAITTITGGVPEHADPGPAPITSPMDAAVAARNTAEMQAADALKAKKEAEYAKATAPINAVMAPPPGFEALEDGTWYNDSTGEFLDPAEQALDPVKKLPNGKFLNLRTKKLVPREEMTADRYRIVGDDEKPVPAPAADEVFTPPGFVTKAFDRSTAEDVKEEMKAEGEVSGFKPPATAPQFVPGAQPPPDAPVQPKSRKRNTSTETTPPADEQQAKVAAAVKAQEAAKATSNGGAQPAPKGLEQVLGAIGMPPAPRRQ